jgi:glycosyltransferase involved in cell wall biosynthesis
MSSPSIMPLVSFVIPAFNSDEYIGDTLGSISGQQANNYEVVVVDDCSTDGTAEIVKTWAARDPRVRYVHGAGKGPGEARNLGIRQAAGEWICFVDSDDLVHSAYSSAIQEVAPRVSTEDVLVISFTSTVSELHGEPLRVTRASKTMLALRGKAIWRLCCRRALFESREIQFPSLYNYEDAVVTAGLLARGGDFYALQPKLYFYRRRPDSLVSSRGARRRQNAIAALDLLREQREGQRELAARWLLGLSIIRVVLNESSRLLGDERSSFLCDALRRSGLSFREAAALSVPFLAYSRFRWSLLIRELLTHAGKSQTSPKPSVHVNGQS